MPRTPDSIGIFLGIRKFPFPQYASLYQSIITGVLIDKTADMWYTLNMKIGYNYCTINVSKA